MAEPMDLVTRTCIRCKKPFQVIAVVRSVVECPECVERETVRDLAAWQESQRIDVGRIVATRLTAVGLSPAECGAELDKVPVALRRLIPKEEARLLIAGAPLTGFSSFGLSGGQGIGKTMCLAALVRAFVQARILAAIGRLTEAPAAADVGTIYGHATSIRWVSVPHYAAWAKNTIMQDRGSAIVEASVASAAVCEVLVLDDLGRERIGKGGYDEDFAVALLDRIIDARSRSKFPLLWTTNLQRHGVAARYGAALTSRLLGLAPVVETPTMPDIRLAAP